MTLHEYFKLAYRQRLVYKRHWLVRAFTIVGITAPGEHQGIGDFFITETGAFTHNEDGEVEAIEGYTLKQPLFDYKAPVTAKAGDTAQLKEDTETFYSTLVTNLLVFEFAFGDKIPYQNYRMNGKAIDKLMAQALKDKTITVPEYRNHTRGLSMLTVLVNACVPSATRKTLIPPADIEARRDALLEKHKDQLHDPVVIAKIEDELIQYYREYMKGDLAEGFYLKDKAYNVSLKRTHMMFGGEPKLENPSEYDLAIPSLREGWQIKDLPMMVNSLRMGSYNRGASTALGGEAAKFSARIFQNTKLSEEDCGSTVGMPFKITEYNKGLFVGRYLFKGKKLEEVQAGDLDSQVGKTLYFRSPQTCWTDNGNYCGTCMGRLVADSGIGLGPQASAVGSAILSSFLAMMHGSKLETKKMNYLDALS